MLHYISGTPTGRYSNKCEKHAGSLLARLNFSGTSDVLKRGLHEYIDDLQVALNETGQAIFETYVFLPQDASQPQVFLTPWDPAGYHLQKQQEQQQQQSAHWGGTTAPDWMRHLDSGLGGALTSAPKS
jgi:hypothetical protein